MVKVSFWIHLYPSNVGYGFVLDFAGDMPENKDLRLFYDNLVENYTIDEESVFSLSM